MDKLSGVQNLYSENANTPKLEYNLFWINVKVVFQKKRQPKEAG